MLSCIWCLEEAMGNRDPPPPGCDSDALRMTWVVASWLISMAIVMGRVGSDIMMTVVAYKWPLFWINLNNQFGRSI